jgi:hypothetical protein
MIGNFLTGNIDLDKMTRLNFVCIPEDRMGSADITIAKEESDRVVVDIFIEDRVSIKRF